MTRTLPQTSELFPDLVDKAAIARSLGVHTKTVERLDIPYTTVGRKRLYRLGDVRAWLDARVVQRGSAQ
ncbi:hypothetical protein A6A04_12355 [Paramagnetospirillum marisnigri]|uniref:Helix-turn-helix domain-containing protein n=1 Tax=Paramagnetospirillum marisnigri TaxID=1285242 RepID=A0A178MV53_9PROT|nr:helix-turn-helix domain-containing protein [Paramagnetospirillum marisnigri]OAN54032.1 hypothetical protein A6A04_12355 [Paramagnetospirillum marisnigri]